MQYINDLELTVKKHWSVTPRVPHTSRCYSFFLYLEYVINMSPTHQRMLRSISHSGSIYTRKFVARSLINTGMLLSFVVISLFCSRIMGEFVHIPRQIEMFYGSGCSSNPSGFMNYTSFVSCAVEAFSFVMKGTDCTFHNLNKIGSTKCWIRSYDARGFPWINNRDIYVKLQLFIVLLRQFAIDHFIIFLRQEVQQRECAF